MARRLNPTAGDRSPATTGRQPATVPGSAHASSHSPRRERCRARRTRTRSIAVVALAALAGCGTSGPRIAGEAAPRLTWGRVELRQVGTIQRSGLTESSGIVRSPTRPDVFWTIEDSGNEPALYAMDSTGRDLGRVVVRGATNEDWEAIAAGPCPGGSCLYIGDTGDNLEARPSRTIYRVREPWATAGEAVPGVPPDEPVDGAVDAERVVFRYADRPHDVEAMVVSGDGAVHLITKGRSGGILQYRISPEAWTAGGSGVAVATRVDSLHIPPPTSRDRVTDAALASDGRLAVRTLRTLYLFVMDPHTGRLRSPVPRLACDLSLANEPQGEGVTWLDDTRLLLTSEQRGAPLTEVRCGG